MTGATRTLNTNNGVSISKDAYVDEANADTNYGTGVYISVGGSVGAGVDDRRPYITVKLPSKPEDCDVSEDYDGLVSIKLYLYLKQFSGGSTTPQLLWLYAVPPSLSWSETDITYNNRPSLGFFLSEKSLVLAEGWITLDLSTFREVFSWGDELDFMILDERQQAAHFTDLYSRDSTDVDLLPYVAIEYKALAPEPVTELKVAPYENDKRLALLTWTPNESKNFSYYEVWRKIGAGAYAEISGGGIYEQSTSEFYDDDVNAENNLILYKIRTYENASPAGYSDSSEVWMIRPDITTFAVSDITPDVLQELTFTTTPTAIASTPTPVTNEFYEYVFGTPAQADTSSCRVRDLTRTHRYPHTGTQSPTVQIENSLGFKSEATYLGSGNLTVASIAPVAVLRASPFKVAVNETIRFFGEQSYAPAGNKEIASANGYEWDKDHAGAFAADYTTTVPYQDMSWAAAGTKVVALRVKDEDGTYSTHVELSIEVVALVTVDLDSALTNPYEVLDVERSRSLALNEGVEAKKLVRLGEKIVSASIGGFAFTKTPPNTVADDILTLEDVVANNKRVSLTVHGTVRYGALANFRTHTAGGWLGKMKWSATVYLE